MKAFLHTLSLSDCVPQSFLNCRFGGLQDLVSAISVLSAARCHHSLSRLSTEKENTSRDRTLSGQENGSGNGCHPDYSSPLPPRRRTCSDPRHLYVERAKAPWKEAVRVPGRREDPLRLTLSRHAKSQKTKHDVKLLQTFNQPATEREREVKRNT